MILGAHVIISAYGFWLPNDPRGSWSDFVAAWELLKFGRASKVTTRESVARVSHDRERRRAAKSALKYKPVLFSGPQARAIASGFAQAADEGAYRIRACSILPDHVHFVIAAHDRTYEQITQHLKSHATRWLLAENRHPFGAEPKTRGTTPTCWSAGLWKVYIHDESHLRAAIRYVEQNPAKEGKKQQSWRFVVPWAE
ncbi:MAG TPA: transposase [Humisphaera sp.]|jgi:REP element-mobilizing transposase RayT|nr:transposase [Humisphaera sp.]